MKRLVTNFHHNKICLLSIVMLMSLNINAQVIQIEPLDIIGGLSEGTIQATVIPGFSDNTIDKIFDDNPYTGSSAQNSDTLVITLIFDEPVKIKKSNVYFWNNGKWSLEAANSDNDLNNKIGSYQLLVNNNDYEFFSWDSLNFTANEAKFIRLTARNLQSTGVYMGEWILYSGVIFTSLKILPDHPRLVPGTSLQLKAEAVDELGETYQYNLDDPIIWYSDNPLVAIVDELGTIKGISLGTALITAATSALSGTTTASIEADFESINAEPLKIKVALILQDPVIDFVNKRRIHQVRGWSDPMTLVNQLLEELTMTSDGVVQFYIVETYNDQTIFSRLDGEFMTIDTLYYYFSSPSRLYGRNTDGTLQNLAEVQGRVQFDYHAMIDYYDLDTKRNNGIIDEVWVYAYPFASMYESQLVGPHAFWYNSPPMDHPGLEKLLSVMGWNYERGIPEAMESFGHRSESALVHAHGDRWNVFAPDPSSWEIYTRIDKDFPGKAHIGNIHYPPNGMSDYDFGNRRYVNTYADNWKRYPILLDQQRTINCQEWGCSHLGYMRWWFGHLPRFTGVTDGVLNNWWHYIVDYEGAVEKATQLTYIEEKNNYSNFTPNAFYLGQNYPNPFNPVTMIKFSMKEPQHVSIKLYDILGREVKVLVDEWKTAGLYEVIVDGSDLSSGVYLYRLTAGSFNKVKKLVLLR